VYKTLQSPLGHIHEGMLPLLLVWTPDPTSEEGSAWGITLPGSVQLECHVFLNSASFLFQIFNAIGHAGTTPIFKMFYHI